MARIMILDDNPAHLTLMGAILARAGHEILAIQRPQNIIGLIQNKKPDLLVLDIVMPEMFGGTVYQLIREQLGPDLPILICTGTSMQLHSPADPRLRYIQKPFDNDRFVELAELLLQHSTS